MAIRTTLTELRNMQLPDLEKEIQQKRMSLAKMRLGLEMRSFKDSAVYRRDRKELARLLTILGEKHVAGAKDAPKAATEKKTALKTKAKPSKVRAPRSK